MHHYHKHYHILSGIVFHFQDHSLSIYIYTETDFKKVYNDNNTIGHWQSFGTGSLQTSLVTLWTMAK